jgi:hypothetical protein
MPPPLFAISPAISVSVETTPTSVARIASSRAFADAAWASTVSRRSCISARDRWMQHHSQKEMVLMAATTPTQATVGR